MPGTRRAYLNDNVRTEHLKCSACRTQIYLQNIERTDDGGEIRTFGCPHCASYRSLRLAPRRAQAGGTMSEPVADQVSC